ncbi:MAG: DUF4340 domain-containing protein [Candidatus Ornithomonoglobus sp.]
MTRTRKLCGLFLLLLAAAALCFGARLLSEREEEADLTSVMEIDAEDITGLKWSYDGETVELKKEDSHWRYADDGADADQEKIKELTDSIASLKASALLTREEQTEDYGFDEPEKEVVVSTETADTTYTFGAVNDVTDEYYLRITGSESIFMVSKDFASCFDKSREAVAATPEPTEEPEEETADEPSEESGSETENEESD